MAKKKPTARGNGKTAPVRKSKAVSPKKAAPAKTAKKARTGAAVKKVAHKAAAKKKVATLKKATAKKKVVAKKAVAVKKSAPGKVKKVVPVPKKPVKVLTKPAKALPAKTPEPRITKKSAPVVVKPTTPLPPVPKVALKLPATPKPAPIKKRALKERVVMEFYLNSSPHALYELLSTPSGFSEWYCQDVDVRGDQYTFLWDNEREETTMIGRKLGEVIRFHRNDDEDPDAYFEFRVRIDPMTNDVCLVVTDHAWPQEVEETRNLWASQIETLGRVLGA